jgi:phosphopantothenoylcysteine decarboxylase/phosphopantothenate--cysteine ligase
MKTVVIGVTGSIAAYKSLEVVRELTKREITVIPVLTPAAKHFVTPLSLESLSLHKTYSDFFTENESIIHISIMREADIIAIVPATANFIGKIAHGVIDNLLLGIVFASDKPVLIAPAMNKRMWNNRILQENVKKLKKYGYTFIGPDQGPLACQEEGLGRMEEVDIIVEEILTHLEKKKDLKGKKVLITLGRTKEYLDPIRFISNDSSGRFGLEIAKTARRRGADVSLIAGFTDVKIPTLFPVTRIVNTEEMEKETLRMLPSVDIVIMNAACSDFTPKEVKKDKIKKSKGDHTAHLKRTTDILFLIGKRKKKQIIVGFSLDTKDSLSSAEKKLSEKNADIFIANTPRTIGSETVEMKILTKNGKVIPFPEMTKEEASEKIIDSISGYVKRKKSS